MSATATSDILLHIRDLNVSYIAEARELPVIDGLELELRRGEALGLVGESGCGKSTLALAIQGLLPRGRARCRGQVLFADQGDLLAMPERRLRRLRGNRLAMIFQDPMTSLNPYLRVGDQLAEPLRLHRHMQRREAADRIAELLDGVGIMDAAQRLRQFPHEFSGGMRQRAMIAMAMCCDPDLLVADEPTTALDVTTQKRVLEILSRHQRERHMAMLMITHDLGVVADTCDRVAVMYAGQIVEIGSVDTVLSKPRHPYTQALLRAIPSARRPHRLEPLAGAPPSGRDLDAGCRLAPRCRLAQDACRTGHLPLREVGPGHHHRCRRDTTDTAAVTERLPEPTPSSSPLLLSVRGLNVVYPGRAGILRREPDIPAVIDVSLQAKAGEILGIAGESGSGKSTLIRAILQLIPAASGEIILGDKEIRTLPRRQLWQRMQLIFQDPASSLDARMTVGHIIAEPLLRYRVGDAASRRERVQALMDQVGIPASWQDRYPHQLSGGQQQRIGIARALALEPDILFCDEPVSALDVSIQAQILNLLRELQARRGMTMIFVSHDLSVVRYLCDRVLIMQRGRVVEDGATRQVYEAPQHAYTRSLLEAIPGADMLTDLSTPIHEEGVL